MTTLEVAIERGWWELAALCLLLGVTQAAAVLPPDALEGLLEVLEADPQDDASRRKAARGKRRPGGLRAGHGRGG